MSITCLSQYSCRKENSSVRFCSTNFAGVLSRWILASPVTMTTPIKWGCHYVCKHCSCKKWYEGSDRLKEETVCTGGVFDSSDLLLSLRKKEKLTKNSKMSFSCFTKSYSILTYMYLYNSPQLTKIMQGQEGGFWNYHHSIWFCT